MKSILLSLFLNCLFFSILALLELRIDVYLANLLIILVPSITSAILKSSPDSCVKCYTMFLPFLLIKIDVF
ncbi:hypothetical protein K4R96_11455, partial [Staphylococcus epidermidis]|nr:hypothetical protein [Staphylococcus epidermidis]